MIILYTSLSGGDDGDETWVVPPNNIPQNWTSGGYIWFWNTSVVVVVIATCFSYFCDIFYQSIESTTHLISLNILFCSKRNHIQNYFSCMTNSNSWISNMKNWLWFIIYWTISLYGKTTKTYSKELLHQWLECQRNRNRYLVNQNKRSSLDFH